MTDFDDRFWRPILMTDSDDRFWRPILTLRLQDHHRLGGVGAADWTINDAFTIKTGTEKRHATLTS